MDVQKIHFEACNMPQSEELNISCRTSSSGCDVEDMLDTSMEDFGSPLPLQPRKLSFNNMDCNNSPEFSLRTNNNNKIVSIAPTGKSPYFVMDVCAMLDNVSISFLIYRSYVLLAWIRILCIECMSVCELFCVRGKTN